MKRKLLFVFLLMIISAGLFAESDLGINVGFGQAFLKYIPSGSTAYDSDGKDTSLNADDRAIHVQLEYDYLFTKNFGVNVQGDVGFSFENTVYATKYNPMVGYGAKAGVDLYLSFLRLGGGIRYLVTRGGYTGGEMSFRTLFMSMNLDILIKIGEKNSLVLGAEYGYPLTAKMVGKSYSGGSLETSLNLKKKFFETGFLSFYGGYKFKF